MFPLILQPVQRLGLPPHGDRAGDEFADQRCGGTASGVIFFVENLIKGEHSFSFMRFLFFTAFYDNLKKITKSIAIWEHMDYINITDMISSISVMR